MAQHDGEDGRTTAHVVALDEAAQRLKIPEMAVEAALERGILEGFRDRGGRWQVKLDEAGAAADDALDRGAGTAPDDGSAPARSGESPAGDDQKALIALLRDEVRYLRQRLADREDALIEKDKLISRLLDQASGTNRDALLSVIDARRADPMPAPGPREASPPASAPPPILPPDDAVLADRLERELAGIRRVLAELGDHLRRQAPLRRRQPG